MVSKTRKFSTEGRFRLVGLDDKRPRIISLLRIFCAGIKWGSYVGAPGNEPVLCWKHKHRAPMASLVPLTTGDVFGLPTSTTLILGYNKEKGSFYLFNQVKAMFEPMDIF